MSRYHPLLHNGVQPPTTTNHIVTPQIKLELILLNYLVVVVLIDDVYLIILWQVIE
jgi:hypothetical protein